MGAAFWRVFAEGGHGMVWPRDEAIWKHRRAVYNLVKRPGRIEGWEDLALVFREDGVLVDNLPCVAGFDVYSPRMRQVIDGSVTDADQLQWLPVTVHDPAGSQEHDYWVLNPLTGPDGVDVEASVYADVPTGLIKAVLDLDLVGDRQVLKYPYGFPPMFSEAIRARLVEAGCTGSNFAPVPDTSRRSC